MNRENYYVNDIDIDCIIDNIFDDMEAQVCKNCRDFHNGHCLLPKIGHRYNRPETFGCTDFVQKNDEESKNNDKR